MTPKTNPASPARARRQLGMSIPVDVDARARQVVRDLTHAEAPTYSKFLVEAVLAHVARLEAEHHDGQPWPAATSAQTRHAGIGRGQVSEVRKRTVSTYPSEEEAGRIRGAARGMKVSLSQLVTEAIVARVGEPEGTVTGEAPDHGRTGRPIGPGQPS